MLQRKAVEAPALTVLEELMKMKALTNFQLVGGTALALQLGHRVSIDIDVFSNLPFDNNTIIGALKNEFKERFSLSSRLENKLGVFGFIDNIKIDLCRHPYPLIDTILIEEHIRMWSLKEIAAAKVNAVSRRATKKDFWDIDRLLDEFTIADIAKFYHEKYNPMLAIGVAQMLTYFDEAEESQTPLCLLGKTWEGVKKSIFKKINGQTK